MKREKTLFYKYENKATGRNKFTIAEKMLYGANINCFTTKEAATSHFEKSYKVALDRYEKIIDGMQKLKESLGDFSYDYFFHGDTHGIYEDGLYIEISVNDYDFQFSQN